MKLLLLGTSLASEGPFPVGSCCSSVEKKTPKLTIYVQKMITVVTRKLPLIIAWQFPAFPDNVLLDIRCRKLWLLVCTWESPWGEHTKKEKKEITLRIFQTFYKVISESKILFKLIQPSLCIFWFVCFKIIQDHSHSASSWHLSMKLQFWGHRRKPVWGSEERQRFLLPTDIFLKRIRIPFSEILMLPPDDKIFSGELLESIARSEVKLEWIRRSVINDSFFCGWSEKDSDHAKISEKVWCDDGGFVIHDLKPLFLNCPPYFRVFHRIFCTLSL